MGDGELRRVSDEIVSLRRRHRDTPLEIDDLDPDPFVQFARWMEEALAARPEWPNAMTLATSDAAGRPSARTVLLRTVDRTGFVFYTNYESRKGRELDANPAAALVFYWPELERQVCIRGAVERLERAASDDYFRTRPRGSKLGAWASLQSRPLEDRGELEQRVADAEERFGDDVPLPDHWGGYRVVPRSIEFWKSRSDRLHDRFVYEREPEGWRITRLYP